MEAGKGVFGTDAVVTSGTLRLRAERDYPLGSGRIYLLVVEATDASGNTAVKAVTVVVPLVPTTSHLTTLRGTAAQDANTTEANDGTPPANYGSLLASP